MNVLGRLLVLLLFASPSPAVADGAGKQPDVWIVKVTGHTTRDRIHDSGDTTAGAKVVDHMQASGEMTWIIDAAIEDMQMRASGYTHAGDVLLTGSAGMPKTTVTGTGGTVHHDARDGWRDAYRSHEGTDFNGSVEPKLSSFAFSYMPSKPEQTYFMFALSVPGQRVHVETDTTGKAVHENTPFSEGLAFPASAAFDKRKRPPMSGFITKTKNGYTIKWQTHAETSEAGGHTIYDAAMTATIVRQGKDALMAGITWRGGTRGGQLTLDPSPSTGNPVKYHWVVNPRPCPAYPPGGAGQPPTGTSAPSDEKVWSFVALCDMDVSLTVTDKAGNFDTDTIEIDVSQRSWHLATPDKPHEVPGTGTIVENPPVFPAGMNRCDKQTSHHIADATDGWIHHTHNRNDWDEQVTVGTVSDDGPFKGLAYVSSHDLSMDRMMVINDLLLPGGLVYLENAGDTNQAAMDSWLEETRQHERMHSTIAREVLAEDGADAAVAVEALVASDAAQLHTVANGVLGKLEIRFGRANDEPEVGNRLKNDWNKELLLCYRNRAWNLGPMYLLGTHEGDPAHTTDSSTLHCTCKLPGATSPGKPKACCSGATIKLNNVDVCK